MNSEKTTFWNLLEEVDRIVIPVIQRDYAQGRRGKGVEDIRDNFIDSIKTSLVTGQKLDLNFVYGSSEDDKFVPIDGQQRLTTLYLLHLYVFIATGVDISKKKYNPITHFRYETRTSSSDFCTCMTTEKNIIKKGIKDIPAIKTDKNTYIFSDEIKDNSWFSSAWLNDPTIDAMLCMLDTIHREFKDEDLDEIRDLLMDEDECPMYFYYLELGKFGLEDSIYIKLNARGKALTNYENFKAKLSKYLTDKKNTHATDYIAKLDGKWSELFWKYHDQYYLYDEKIMNFIFTFIINEYSAFNDKKGRDEIRNDIREKAGFSHLEFINRFHVYDIAGHTIEEYFDKIFKVFDLLEENGHLKIYAPRNPYMDEAELFKYIIEGKEAEKGENKDSISMTTRIKAYAYHSFLSETEGDFTTEELISWLRVIDTLSRETNYNGQDDYVRAIQGVLKMLPSCKNILQYLSGLTEWKSPGFDQDCFEEECIKAKLILKEERWKDIVLLAESNKYFHGQIGFLLEFSGIWKEFNEGNIENWSQEESDNFYECFKKYYEILSGIFGEFSVGNTTYVGLNRDFANLWRRALLAKGDYTYTSGNTTFLIDNHRDRSWKRILRIQRNETKGTNKITFADKRGYLRSVIDDALFDLSDIKGSLKKICENSVGTVSDWRKYFVEVPKLMDDLYDYSKSQPVERFVRREGNNIFLMGATRLYGYNDEYYSYAAYCILEEKGVTLSKYNRAKGWDDIDFHMIATRDSGDYMVKYDRLKMNFRIKNKSTGNVEIEDTVEGVIKNIIAK